MKHTQVIKNEQFHACEVCGESFKYSHALLRHAITHSDVKHSDAKHSDVKHSDVKRIVKSSEIGFAEL